MSSTITSAQESKVLRFDSLAPIVKGDLNQLSWIVGNWEGEAFGAKTEEVWTGIKGGSLMGMFKLYDDSGVVFYELMTIRELDESLIMQLKHFNSDLSGWEEKEETVDFKLVKTDEKMVYFDGLSFEYISIDRMNVYVLISDEGGEEVVKFEYSKVR